MLTVGGYDTDLFSLGDSMAGGASLHRSNGMKFSTFDKDQDIAKKLNCASKYYGGFWYGKCHSTNPNGLYLWGKTSHYATGVVWYWFKGHNYSLKYIAFKIRPVS